MEEGGEDGGGRGKCVQPLLADLMNLIGTQVTATYPIKNYCSLSLRGLYQSPSSLKFKPIGSRSHSYMHSVTVLRLVVRIGHLNVYQNGPSIYKPSSKRRIRKVCLQVQCFCRKDVALVNDG